MHSPEIKAEALELIAAGHNDCEVSRITGVPRRTILDWRRPTYVPRLAHQTCPRCWRPAKRMRFTAAEYCELLALYLGDGCISGGARTQRLRLHLDAKYEAMNEEIRSLLRRCFPDNLVTDVKPAPSPWSGRDDSWLILSVYSTHLSCLLPQHGPGKKHERKIALEAWQDDLLKAEPWPFIRGCIRTDGCAFVNRTDVHRAKPYEYLTYAFSNMSRDIVDLFCGACDRVGVDYRVNHHNTWHVRINRRASVAAMLEHVGMKT